ncbi:hypothetical protein PTKIN_Ptkin10aG0187600 [Pterospermum kingtungense]
MVHFKKLLSKSLTTTDIKKRMAIPTRILCSSHVLMEAIPRNKFNVGDKLALYKVLQDEDEDEAESFYYRVQVENHACPSRDIFASLSHSHEVDETPGPSRKRACDSENKQEQLLEAGAVLSVQEEAVTELVDVAADAPVALVDHVISKPKPSSIRIFGTNMCTHEATSKAHFKTEEGSKMNLINVAMACGSSTQAVGDGYYKSRNERLCLDMTLPQPTAYAGEVNLGLTLAPPVVDGAMEDTGQHF